MFLLFFGSMQSSVQLYRVSDGRYWLRLLLVRCPILVFHWLRPLPTDVAIRRVPNKSKSSPLPHENHAANDVPLMIVSHLKQCLVRFNELFDPINILRHWYPARFHRSCRRVKVIYIKHNSSIENRPNRACT